jgi:hypothetical protein
MQIEGDIIVGEEKSQAWGVGVMNKFNSELHEDLFELFVYEYFAPASELNPDEDLCLWMIRNQWERRRIVHDLFPKENAPDIYEFYVDDRVIDHDLFCIFATKWESSERKNKILISIEG